MNKLTDILTTALGYLVANLLGLRAIAYTTMGFVEGDDVVINGVLMRQMLIKGDTKEMQRGYNGLTSYHPTQLLHQRLRSDSTPYQVRLNTDSTLSRMRSCNVPHLSGREVTTNNT